MVAKSKGWEPFRGDFLCFVDVLRLDEYGPCAELSILGGVLVVDSVKSSSCVRIPRLFIHDRSSVLQSFLVLCLATVQVSV